MSHEGNTTLKTLLPDAFEHYELRVTMQAAMNKLIQQAQDQLKLAPAVPVVLHTLPLTGPSCRSSDGPLTSTQPSTSTAAPLPIPDPSQVETPPKKASATQSATLAKLVSVAEIIKRQFTPIDDPADKKGKRKQGLGLYQYMYLGALEDVGFSDGQEESDEARQERLALQWLGGLAGSNKRPRMRHTPFLVVVLTIKPSRVLAKFPGFTSQRPARRSKKHLAVPNQPLGDRSNEASETMPNPAQGNQSVAITEKKKRKRVRSRRKSKKAVQTIEEAAPPQQSTDTSAMDET
ncbi:hypothetical protein OIV83_002725 [Microbotryomycetes sp. JL201]|nr:hypothetical protein OIV83_002725 [Microbotryomycetes sp. JL201]